MRPPVRRPGSTPIRRILCPTDFSTYARRALSHAMVLARWFRAEVTVVHVTAGDEPLSRSLDVPDGAPVAPADRLEQLAREIGGTSVRVTTRLAVGDPVERILELADELEVDLVVMGTHGWRGFERWILGSVTEKILRKARCPVLTVPRDEVPSGLGEILFRPILCPVDGSDAAAHAAAWAADLARELKTLLLLLNVSEWVPTHPKDMSAVFRSESQQRLDAALPPERRVETTVEDIVSTGTPHEEILRVAHDRDAGLIVIGIEARSAVDLLLFGSTTNHVVRRATCPVLTLRCPRAVMEHWAEGTTTAAGRP